MFHSDKIHRIVAVSATFAILVLALLGTAGCGKGTQGSSITHPNGKRETVLRVSSGGGFVAPAFNLSRVPEFTLYGDGTVIVTGATPAIYPGPALPSLQTATVTERTIQAILSAAQEAGLLRSSFDYGTPGITDVATTTITVNAGGNTYASNIYALGMDAGGGTLTLEQQQARALVSDLVGKLSTFDAFQQGLQWTGYQFASLRIYSTTAAPSGSTDVQPNKLAWPLADLATLGEAVQPGGFRKFTVSGGDLVTLKPLLSQATQITVWTSGGHEYNLVLRPLLPDETA